MAFKARSVTKDFKQNEGIHYFETTPIARLTPLRVLLPLISMQNLFVNQMDVKTTFLGGIHEEVYMK